MGKSTKEWIQEARAFEKEEKFEDAIECYKEAAKLEPNDPKLWYGIGLLMAFSTGDYEESIKYFDKAVKVDPNYADAWIQKGNAINSIVEIKIHGEDENKNEIMGMCDEALKCFEKAIVLKPNESEAWRGKGASLLYLEDKDAIKYIEKALELDPQNVSALCFKALYLFAINDDHDEAIFYINRALQLDPDDEGAQKLRQNIAEDQKRMRGKKPKIENVKISGTGARAQFPKPFDWFQTKIWKLKFLEWCIISTLILLNGIISGKEPFYAIIFVPVMAIIYTFVLTPMLKLMFGLARAVGLAPIAGIFEKIIMYIGAFNNRFIIEKYCEEKPERILER